MFGSIVCTFLGHKIAKSVIKRKYLQLALSPIPIPSQHRESTISTKIRNSLWDRGNIAARLLSP
jgi:hypothetical protein